jgi:hypothetical protein
MSDSMKLAQIRYVDKHRDSVNNYHANFQKIVYNTNEEVRLCKLEKMKEYRDRKRQEKIDMGIEIKPRGRPVKKSSSVNSINSVNYIIVDED